MDASEAGRLSQIQTLWSVVLRARDDTADDARRAQEQLLERYNKVVYRYLLGALRDADAAEELSQEFALRFMRGDLKGANQDRGRFRDFLKGVLFHLIGDHHRRKKKVPYPLADQFDPATSNPGEPDSDREFLESWRGELLNRAWKALALHEEQTGQPLHTVLRLRSENPEMRSEELAARIGTLLSRPMTAPAARQSVHRAREKFAELLVEEIAQTLVDPTLADVENELLEVNLIEYCRGALERLRGAGGAASQ
jgi:RNA polymerase sigma factor (sigma-70 family)